MSITDLRGIEVDLDPKALATWNAVTENLLAHAATTATNLGHLVAARPDFAPALAVKGFALHLLGKIELASAARDALGQARRTARDDNGRGLVEALAFALDGDDLAAATRLEANLAAAPTDALSLKLAHGLRFMAGDAPGMRRALKRHHRAFDPDHPFAGFVAGMHAFTLVETNDPSAADALGRRAVALAPRDAWGRHAVAHGLDATGRQIEAEAWLADETTWAHTNNFGLHMFWHRALAVLDRGAHAEVLALYDTRIRSEATDDFRDIANAVSLLQRLELDGVDVGARWDELALIARRRIMDGRLVFADLHHALALAATGDGEGVETLAHGIAARAVGSGATDRRAARAGTAFAFGLVAFREGDHAEAARLMHGAMDGLAAIGGSTAQRDVFERVLIEALIRAGEHEVARARLEARLAARGGRDRFARSGLARVAAGDVPSTVAALVAATLPIAEHHA